MSGPGCFIRPFQPQDQTPVVALWHECGLLRPHNDPHKDIQRKLRVQADLFLVGLSNDEIVATVMAGYEGHRGWINYLAVKPSHRRSGLGRAMMMAAEERLRAAGCPKINLQVRSSNRDVLAFYQAIGFIPDDVVSLGKRLEQD